MSKADETAASSSQRPSWLKWPRRQDVVRLGFETIAVIDRWQARRKQARYCGCFVGITGSVGKSTATMLMAALLGESRSVKAGLFLNSERHPLRAVRKLRERTDFVVQEISAHQPGALDNVLAGLRIDVAVVTRIGLDHARAFRTPEAVAAEKGRLAEAVGASGVVCLNADDALCRAMASRTKARVVLFGVAADAEMRAENVTAVWPGRLQFDLLLGQDRRHVRTNFVGTLLLPSVLAALAVVHAVGADLDAAISRLSSIEPIRDRLGPLVRSAGHSFVLDTNKASMWSTKLLVDDLPNWGPVRRIFVLGKMSDGGNAADRKYRQILRAATQNCDLVIGVGQSAGSAARMAALEGIPNLLSAGSVEAVKAILDQQPLSLVILKSGKKLPLGQLAAESVKTA